LVATCRWPPLWLAAAEVAVAADAVAAEFGVAAAGEVVAGAPPAAAQVGEAAAGANLGLEGLRRNKTRYGAGLDRSRALTLG